MLEYAQPARRLFVLFFMTGHLQADEGLQVRKPEDVDP